MTTGQTRVVVLLLVLLALEGIRHPTIGNGIKTFLSGFNTSLNNASTGTNSSNGTGTTKAGS